MDESSAAWYVLKESAGSCKIVSSEDLEPVDGQEQWGPFTSREEAIARRVGLIRAGKCQPA